MLIYIYEKAPQIGKAGFQPDLSVRSKLVAASYCALIQASIADYIL